MISLQLKENKAFMSHLLIKDTFDELLLSKAELGMAYSFTIDGSVNKSFFSDEEYEALENKELTPWARIKPFCFSFIKGSRVPSVMKIIFSMPEKQVSEILSDSGTTLTPADVEGLFINIRYKDGVASIVTGTSLKAFSLEKNIDHAFDKYVRKFLDENGIGYEE
jgi:hypothetical protein